LLSKIILAKICHCDAEEIKFFSWSGMSWLKAWILTLPGGTPLNHDAHSVAHDLNRLMILEVVLPALLKAAITVI